MWFSKWIILEPLYLEVVISGHTEPYKGNSMSRHLSPVNSEHMQSEKHFWIWTSLQHSECRVGNPISLSLTSLGSYPNPSEFFLYLNYGHDMKPIGWWSYRVRVKSSLVLLEMFNHPYPTLVVTLNPTVTRSSREWLSYPYLCTNPEKFRCGLISHYNGGILNDCPDRLVSFYLDKRIPWKSHKYEKNLEMCDQKRVVMKN